MLYTVIDGHGNTIAHGLSAYEAAVEILQHDGGEFEIRHALDGEGFDLWVSRNSTAGGRPLVKSQIFSLLTDPRAAETDIAEQVIAARWPRFPEAICTNAEGLGQEITMGR